MGNYMVRNTPYAPFHFDHSLRFHEPYILLNHTPW